MATWVKVDQERLNQPRQEEIAGVTVTVYFSPYDVPELVGGDYEEARSRFVVRFRYPGGPEPRRFEDQDGHVRLGIGRTTGRLHELEIDVAALKAKAVQLKVNIANAAFEEAEAAIRRLRERPTSTTPSPASIPNYLAASGALAQQRDEVFGNLAGLEPAGSR
ncbi:MAG: hypothetical protein KY476_01900 [Planctomycetes bacterium]|nr:hypothetical protein [Planctomycetota bacterium]